MLNRGEHSIGGLTEKQRVGARADQRRAALHVLQRGVGGDAKTANRESRLLGDRTDAINRRDDCRIVDLTHFPHAGRQVVGTQLNRIESLDLDDRLDVFDRSCMFRLDDHGDLVVRPLDVLGKPRTVTVGPGQPHAARTQGGILSPVNDILGLLGRVDLRHDDPMSAEIKHLLDRDFGRFGNPHDARHPMADRLQNGQNFGAAEWAVFTVNEEPVEARVGQHFG